MWIFGYGSLVWRPGFEFLEASPARLDGYARRFWQGSPDHRGTPGALGRVVTLIESADAHCEGRAFRLSAEVFANTLAPLDHREKGGYERLRKEVALRDGRRVEALVYLATPANEHYLGPAPLDEMVEHIANARGPSGPNDEYLLQLAKWLRENDVDDPHVQELASALENRKLG